MTGETDLETFTYEGSEISIDPAAQMWNLNTMHRAAGGEPNKAPAQWLRNQQVQELIDTLKEELNCANLHSLALETREGRGGGTWARRELALAYAHYLNPRFYIACNRWMLRQLDGQAEPATPARLAAIEARLAALESRRSAPTAAIAGLATRSARLKPRERKGRLVYRHITERITEIIELVDVPEAPRTEAALAALRQAGRPLRPREITALLQAAGLAVVPVQVSQALWALEQAGRVVRHEDGSYSAREGGEG